MDEARVVVATATTVVLGRFASLSAPNIRDMRIWIVSGEVPAFLSAQGAQPSSRHAPPVLTLESELGQLEHRLHVFHPARVPKDIAVATRRETSPQLLLNAA